MEHCFDEGTIQAFLDGELASGVQESVARHVAVCDACARLLDEAEQDAALAFSALETEFNQLVPTERIRTSLYEKIAEIEKPRKSVWRRLAGAVALGDGFSLGSPIIASFASLILIVGLLTIVFTNRQPNDERAVVAPNGSINSITPALPNSGGIEQIQNGSADAPRAPVVINDIPREKPLVNSEPARAERIKFTPVRQTRTNVKPDAILRDPPRKDDARVAKEPHLPGEESYIKTIATLAERVERNKDETLKPSARVAFEKDLAVVNDAIKKMRKEVRRDPNNEAARQVLRSSYQMKIDLLNSVADKSEMMASLD